MIYRKVEVNRNKQWVQVPLSAVKKGDLFRMFEDTGEPVIMSTKTNRTEAIAICDAYKVLVVLHFLRFGQ